VDVELVDSIVQVAGPGQMDVKTWEMIYQGTSMPNVYLAESLLAMTHEMSGLSWLAAIPVTVIIMRSCTAPLHIMQQVNGHRMAVAAPKMQDAQRDMMLATERGVSIADAQVC
jgi:membrane protein insertase Oxa1/YidC/SpoIIIJ